MDELLNAVSNLESAAQNAVNKINELKASQNQDERIAEITNRINSAATLLNDASA